MKWFGGPSCVRKLCALTVMVLALLPASRAVAGPVGPAVATFGNVVAIYDFNKNPIPVNVPFPGSAGFNGPLAFQGLPSDPALFGPAEAVVSVTPTGTLTKGSPLPVSLDLTGLRLTSVSPISFLNPGTGTTQQYNVFITLDPTVANPGAGQATVSKKSGTLTLDGGIINAHVLIGLQPVGGGPGIFWSSTETLIQQGPVTVTKGKGITGTFNFSSSTGGLNVSFGAPVSSAPEPATLALAGLGALGLLGYGWRRRRRPAAA